MSAQLRQSLALHTTAQGSHCAVRSAQGCGSSLQSKVFHRQVPPYGYVRDKRQRAAAVPECSFFFARGWGLFQFAERNKGS